MDKHYYNVEIILPNINIIYNSLSKSCKYGISYNKISSCYACIYYITINYIVYEL